MLVKKANNEDLDQTAPKKKSDLGLLCLSGPSWLAFVHNFNIVINIIKYL